MFFKSQMNAFFDIYSKFNQIKKIFKALTYKID